MANRRNFPRSNATIGLVVATGGVTPTAIIHGARIEVEVWCDESLIARFDLTEDPDQTSDANFHRPNDLVGQDIALARQKG